MPKVEHRKYGELKVRRSFMLTPTAISMLEVLAYDQDLSMNEFLEQMIRWAKENRLRLNK